MTAISHVITCSQEQLPNAVLDQQGTAEYSHDFEDRSSELEVMLNNGNKIVYDDGDMDLNFGSIFGFAPKCFDMKVLLNSSTCQR